MTTINSKDDAVDKIADGHRLRHTKQLALRGNARCYDENGVCGKQRLVVCCDPKSFLEYKALLFPGAPDPIIVGEVMENQTTTMADRVLDALSNTDPAVSIVPTRYLEKAIGKPWRSVSRRVLTKSFRAALGGLGWRYVTGKGRKGSWFERLVELRLPETSSEEDTSQIEVTMLEALAA
jgi:hypothetical protein